MAEATDTVLPLHSISVHRNLPNPNSFLVVEKHNCTLCSGYDVEIDSVVRKLIADQRLNSVYRPILVVGELAFNLDFYVGRDGSLNFNGLYRIKLFEASNDFSHFF